MSVKQYSFVKNNIYNLGSLMISINDKHNFRQEEIVNQWEKFCCNFNQNVFYCKINITVSSGFYVRQFVRDLSEILNFPLVVKDIYRVRINY